MKRSMRVPRSARLVVQSAQASVVNNNAAALARSATSLASSPSSPGAAVASSSANGMASAAALSATNTFGKTTRNASSSTLNRAGPPGSPRRHSLSDPLNASSQNEVDGANLAVLRARQTMRKIWSSPSYLKRYRNLDLDPQDRWATAQYYASSGGGSSTAVLRAQPLPSDSISSSARNPTRISTLSSTARSNMSATASSPASAAGTQTTSSAAVLGANEQTRLASTSHTGAAQDVSERDDEASSFGDSRKIVEEDDSSDWAFGGGSMSQSGPSRRALPLRFGTGLHGVDPSSERQYQRLPDDSTASGSSQQQHQQQHHQPAGIIGSAGKGAVPNYGRRNRIAKPRDLNGSNPGEWPMSEVEQADQAIAAAYVHNYSPTTRSEKALPQHTYFSSPSSSFNASSFVAPGTAPPLSRVLSAAGVGQYSPGGIPKRKKTALIMPGQGSQYVGMGKNMYKTFRSAREIWHTAEEALLLSPNVMKDRYLGAEDFAANAQQREAFELELAKTAKLDSRQGFGASATGITRSRRGWLRDLVFSGDQLDLTRAENAQPAILTCTMAFLIVLKEEFNVDLVKDHMCTAAGHGTGNYAAMIAAGACSLSDAVRLLRHRGLASSHFLNKSPILFPPGSEPPLSIYETWGFSNAGSGKGADLFSAVEANLEEPARVSPPGGSTGRGWRRSQMAGVVLKPGKLQAALMEVERTNIDIKAGRVEGFHPDEFVEVANYNSSLQIVLGGTKLGVTYASDRLRARGFGARAVNLPVSGPYHTSIMQEASNFLKPAVAHLPLREPHDLRLFSSFSGEQLPQARSIREDLSGALARPVRWNSTIEAMLADGVERFICLGPGRACAHLLSKELAYRDRISHQQAQRGLAPAPTSEFEVWSVASVEDVLQLGSVLEQISSTDGHVRENTAARNDVIAI